MRLVPGAPGYPSALYALDEPPAITVSGPLEAGPRRAVAIVGSRDASHEAWELAFRLAYHLAKANVVVVSGGAVGVDTAAHSGALAAGGSTWLVSPAGRGARLPRRNLHILEEVEGAPASRVVWPFEDGTPIDQETPRRRNAVLVALAECVVVVQAAFRSGSRHAARQGRAVGRRVFVVPGRPWDYEFAGSMVELMGGAEPLWSVEWLFEKLGLPPPDLSDPGATRRGGVPRPLAPPRRRPQLRLPAYAEPPRFRVDRTTWTEDEKVVFSCLSQAPTQRDTIVDRAGLPTSATVTALLTLSLKDVVVEGPDGFFRCRNLRIS